MVGSAEWVQNSKKLISCLFGNKEPEKFRFDIAKTDKIFDLLLSGSDQVEVISQDPNRSRAEEYKVLQVVQCNFS